LVFDVSTDDYDKYRYHFDAIHYPRTWIESAFEYKSVKLFIDSERNPSISILLYPYHAFIVGDPDASEVAVMLDTIPEGTEMHVDPGKWQSKLKEHFGKLLYQKMRIKLSHNSLRLESLAQLKKPLLKGYSIERVDKKTVEQLPPILQVHIPPFFGGIDNFMERGIGFCVKHGDAPISMAGSCIPYTDKLEVQIATVDSPEYRRRGFATVAGIALLEYCLKNNIQPYWDATNESSAIMAERLGYKNPERYHVYKWLKKGNK
jgi:hypothetical protein